jgi:gas vesicle structural protein
VSQVEQPLQHQVTLLELVDRVLNRGVVLSGDITLSVAGVDLVYVGLRVLLASVGTLERLEREGSGNGQLPVAPGSAR